MTLSNESISLSVGTTTYTNSTKHISGQIIDHITGKPIAGVVIMVKGTTNMTLSDVTGYYSITAKQGNILTVSCKRYKDESISIGYGSVINFRMKKK